MRSSALRIPDLDEVVEYGTPHPRRRHLRVLPDPQAAISVDQSTLGTLVDTNPSTSHFAITTSQAAAAGALIVIGFGWFTDVAATITSVAVSGGSLTWSVPVSNGFSTNTDACALAWALAPSGLPTNTVITLTASPSSVLMDSPTAVASSFLGVASSSPLDGTSSKTYAAITAGAYTGNAVSITGSSDLVIACAVGDGQTATTTSATANSGWTQGPLASQAGTIGGVSTLIWQLNVSSSGTPGGTWGAGQPAGTAVVAAGFLSGALPVPVQSTLKATMKARH